MDLFDKCFRFTDAKRAMAEGNYPYFLPLEETEGTEVVINGRRLIMIGSNNYLGLTTHPKVRKAAREAIDKYGTSCTGSRFLNGTLELHRELERKLAQFVRKEAALVFSTGFQTNLGVISALVGKGEVVILDHDDHASIVDGSRLCSGEVRRFPHNDMEGLEKVLRSCEPAAGKLVVVDGVFSMGGDIAPLPDIIALCKKYGARLMVDDAHSIGVLGEDGRGTSSHFGVEEEVDLIMGTFSKSFASLGGFIAGSEPVIHYIQHFARSLIFSASMPPPCLAAVLAALEVMQTEPHWRERVLAHAAKMRKGFQELGFDTGASQTPVIPIMTGDMNRTFAMWKGLFAAGVYVNPVIPPAVPPNKSLLRTSYMATHTEEQLDRVLAVFAEVGEKVGMLPPARERA
jgi:8-amino-7-oxononanoate synthase